MDFEPSGVHVRLHINGVFGDGVGFQVQPFSTNEAFLSLASQKLNLSSVATLAYDQNGLEVDVMGLEDDTDVFLSGGEPFISPTVSVQPDGAEALVVGNYVCSKFLGKGAFGQVYLGAHNITGKKVALKLMPMEELGDLSSVERVATEVQALTSLRHPHIIELLEVSVDPKNVVLVFEFASQGDMLHYLSSFEEYRCPPDEAEELLDQIIDGISYAHRHRVCHRDLKLENLLMCNAPQQLSLGDGSGSPKPKVVVKIADFGLSAFFRPGADFVTNCGSLSYIAPEVLEGNAHEGPPLDVWSLGVIFFAMLCGRLPFTNERLGEDERTDTRRIRKRVVDVSYKFDEGMRSAHMELIKSMLRPDPEKRATIPQVVHAASSSRDNSFAKTAAMLQEFGGDTPNGDGSTDDACLLSPDVDALTIVQNDVDHQQERKRLGKPSFAKRTGNWHSHDDEAEAALVGRVGKPAVSQNDSRRKPVNSGSRGARGGKLGAGASTTPEKAHQPQRPQRGGAAFVRRENTASGGEDSRRHHAAQRAGDLVISTAPRDLGPASAASSGSAGSEQRSGGASPHTPNSSSMRRASPGRERARGGFRSGGGRASARGGRAVVANSVSPTHTRRPWDEETGTNSGATTLTAQGGGVAAIRSVRASSHSPQRLRQGEKPGTKQRGYVRDWNRKTPHTNVQSTTKEAAAGATAPNSGDSSRGKRRGQRHDALPKVTQP